MRRKTNLFYTSASQDSNFLTFSNYTEALTGNLMSTDNKIYPSRFLCLQLDKLNDRNFAVETYNKWKSSILDSNNVRYKLKNNVLKCWIDNSSDDLVGIYDKNGKKWVAGTYLTKEEVEEALAFTTVKTIVEYYKNDSEHTKIKEVTNNVNKLYVISIEKTYMDYKDDPKFLNNAEDQLSVYLWNKQKLIDLLVSHYENKLATLRDIYVEIGENQEKNLLPLNYLLETLEDFDSSMKINYIGDVTEQDWNGTFTDTICVVNTNKFKSGTIVKENDTKLDLIEASSYKGNSDRYLHGWFTTKHPYIPELDFDKDGDNTISIYKDNNSLYDNLDFGSKDETWIYKFKKSHKISTGDTDDYNSYIMQFPIEGENPPKEYQDTLDAIIKASEITEEWIGPHYVEDLVPIYDNEDNGKQYYNTSSDLVEIKYKEHDNVLEWKNVEFNLLIPLFDLVDMNYNTNSTSIENSSYMALQNENQEEPIMMLKNVPLGIWFSGPQNVILKGDLSTGFSPTWSLSLSSQFKPFPNSTYMPDEISQDAKKEAYLTFAQILSRQNEILDKFSDMTKIIDSLSKRMSSIESSIGGVLTSYNIDNFRTDIADFKNQMTYQVSYLGSTIENIELKWVDRQA